jgi:hypothetical protein
MVNKIPDEDTSLRIKRRTSSHLAITQKKLGFHSADELISVLIDVLTRKGWTKTNLEDLARFGRIIDFLSGSAKNDEEMYEALGIKKYTQTDKIKAKVKAKPKEELK